MIDRYVNVLGTNYIIKIQTEEENKKLKEADGLCETQSKEICLMRIDNDPMNLDDIEKYKNKVLRHELLHAFLYESGLSNNTEWATNEEIVDWIALQFPKISKAFEELKCNL